MSLFSAPTCRRSLRGASLPDDWAQRLDRAVVARDRTAFTNGMLVALATGHAPDARLLTTGAALLADERVLAAVAPRLSGPVGESLLAAARDGRLAPLPLLVALRLAARTHPAQAAAWTRALARRMLPAETEDLLAAFADELQDADLNTVLEAEGLPYASPEARRDWKALDALGEGEVLACIPEDPPPTSVSGFTVRRGGSKVGRNDPCPCGSGKKHKKCCLGKEAAAPPVTAEMLAALDGPALVALEAVPAELVQEHIHALVARYELEAATALIEQHGAEDPVMDAAMAAAAYVQRDDLLERMAARARQLPLSARIRLAEAPLDVLEEAARAEPSLDLAYGALDAGCPGLALHLMRGLLPLASAEQAPEMLATLLETRDRLGMAPVDPIETELRRFAAWAGTLETEADQEREARQKLEAELRAARIESSRLRNELASRPEPVAEPEEPDEPATEADVSLEEVQRLRQALAREKAAHKAIHEERNRLRLALREVEAAQDQADEQAEPDQPAPTEETYDAGVQPPRLPVFEPAFIDALAALPEHNQRGALELIGRMAAGREDAFRLARPLRGRREVWRVRLQRSYRVLFTMEGDTLRVLDIVHRQDLERRIRVLWRS